MSISVPERLSPAIPFQRLDAVELTGLVRKLAAQPQIWEPKLEFCTTRRWWTQLIANPAVDVWLLSWLTEQGTELHDHGSSAAAFTVVRGDLSEVRTTVRGSLRSTPVTAGAIRWVPPGAVHDVSNPHLSPAVSIHAYSPPLSQMTFYEQGPSGLVATRTEHTNGPEREEAR